jgi:hypothetical protein
MRFPVAKRTIILVLTIALAPFGCTGSNESSPASSTASDRSGASFYMKDAYDKLGAHLADCTSRTGYDPKAAQTLGAYQITPAERQWRECAYAGVRSIALPATKYPELYTALIDKDKAMTEQIAARRMTRAERRRQLDVNIRRIQEQERTEALRARPSEPVSPDRNQQIARQSMDSINAVMGSFR